MFSWARQSLVLCAALLLALPPGWCCFTPLRGHDAAPPAQQRGCCHGAGRHAEHEPAPIHHEPPAVPMQSCCCLTDTILPPDPTTAPADSAAAPVMLPAGMTSLPAETGPIPAIVFHWTPPLRILHCLWLC
jgi:hypothetical protein